MSDILAFGALEAAGEHGVPVPSKLSVVGFDDTPGAAHATPPLTTVAQPHQEKGRLAAEQLIDAIERGGTGEPSRTLLPTELVVRGSTATPG
jgi:DNA-binding LacI/PurR family transcriptional regulator